MRTSVPNRWGVLRAGADRIGGRSRLRGAGRGMPASCRLGLIAVHPATAAATTRRDTDIKYEIL